MSEQIISTSHQDKQGEEGIIAMLKRAASISQILRFCGAMSVVASLSIFLLQGWDAGNDVSRFYLLLGQTVLLALGGFGLAHILKENKGARVFFGLSLIAVMASMTTLGALIYSIVQWGSELMQYPQLVTWKASSPAAAFQAVTVALLVLAPITLLGFRILAHQSFKQLSFLYLSTGALLLIPVRDSFYSTLLAGGALVFSLIFVSRLANSDKTLKTTEGYFARAVIFIAPMIMMVRGLWLYQVDAMIIMMMSLTGLFVSRHFQRSMDVESRLHSLLSIFSVLLSLAMSTSLMILLERVVDDEWMLPVFMLAFTVSMLEQVVNTPRNKRMLLGVLNTVVSITALLQFAIHGGVFNAVFVLVLGIMVVAVAWMAEMRYSLTIGLITTVVGGFCSATELYTLINLASWSSFAALGVIAIVLGSVIERHGVTLKLKLQRRINGLKLQGL